MFPVWLLLAALLVARPAAALDVPPRPQGRVSDYAGLLQPPERQRLEQRLQQIEETNSNQFAVALFRSLEGDSLEAFSIRLAEAWQVGQAGRDNGLLLLVFAEDRQVRIEVGYGLEGTITDALAGRVIREILGPHFRAGDYAGGLLAAVEALDQASRGEFTALPSSPDGPSSSRGLPVLLIFFVLAGILSALRRSVMLGGRGRHGTSLWWLWLGGLGGRSGGGFGGGGFGGGGFSGGGGGFGGGGASGGW